MKLPEIQDYQFGRMVIDESVHTRDLIILPDKVISNWWRMNGHTLDRLDLGVVFEVQPEVLVVGTGADGMMKVPEGTRKAVESAGIQIKIALTGEAWQLYNNIRENKRTAAAFHLTC